MKKSQVLEIRAQEKLNSKRKRKISAKCQKNLSLSLCWMNVLQTTKTCDSDWFTVDGAVSSAKEAVALISLGLYRPAVLSLRSFYEISLMNLYYKDHQSEWLAASKGYSNLLLPGKILEHLTLMDTRHKARWKKLNQYKKRREENVYKALSGVAHGSRFNSVIIIDKPSDIVSPVSQLSQSPEIFYAVSEMISDICVSSFQFNWASLPEDCKENLISRMDNPKRLLNFL